MSEQQRANVVRKACQEFSQRLKILLQSTGDGAIPAIDKLDHGFVDGMHATVCEELEINAESSNLRAHPWRRSGWATKKSR